MIAKAHRSWFVVTLLITASLILAACAPTAAAPTTAAAQVTPTVKEFKVGLVVPSPITDAWSGLAYAAAKKMESDLGAKISSVEVADPAGYEKAFTDFGSQGYDFVIGHGFQYQDAVAKVSPQFPNTFFTTSGGDKSTANFAPIDMTEGFAQSQYALCAMVGKISKTHKAAGFVLELPATKIPEQGCQQGFESIPGNKFNLVILSDQNDVAGAKEAGLQAISEGADVLIGNANLATTGILQAAVEHGPGVYFIGIVRDYSSDAPDNTIVSMGLDFTSALYAVGKSVKEGTAKGGKPIDFTVENPEVYPVFYNPKMDSVVTPEMKQFYQDTINKIKSGEITVLNYKK